MIVIYFWYIVCCNVFVYLNGLSIIYVLIPGCGAAAIANTENAYEYPEENTELETFSPELTDPIPSDFFSQSTKDFEKVGAFEDISKISSDNKGDNGGVDAENTSELLATSITEITTPLTILSEQTDNSFEAIAKTSNTTTTSQTSTSCSDTSTRSKDLSTISIMNETTPPSTFVSEHVNNSFEATTQTSDSTTISQTSISRSDSTSRSTDLSAELITILPESNDSSVCAAKTSVFHSDWTTNAGDLYTTESTIKPIAIGDQIYGNCESIPSGASISEHTGCAAEATKNCEESATNVEVAEFPSRSNLSFSSELPEKAKIMAERLTEPVTSGSSTYLESELSSKNLLEKLHNEVAEIITRFTPRYEEGYYNPKIAPTRYGQGEEYIMTTTWKYVSDYGIGMRDYNLILYAVNNSAVLEKGSLLNYVYFVFKEVLHVNMTLIDIRYCRYLRSKNQDNAKKVPPVLVAFTKMDVKNEILHKRKLLKPTGIKVEHDMPRKILDEQNALLKPLMDKYRAMGQYVVVRSGKLLVEGKVLTQINLPDKYTYDPLQTFVSYVTTTAKPTTPAIQLPREFMDYGFGGDKKSGKKKKGGRAAGGKRKRKPVVRIPLDEEIGDELSALVLFTTKKFWL